MSIVRAKKVFNSLIKFCDGLSRFLSGAKDNTRISELAYSGYILCRLPLGNGHKGDNENRPRKKVFKALINFRTE